MNATIDRRVLDQGLHIFEDARRFEALLKERMSPVPRPCPSARRNASARRGSKLPLHSYFVLLFAGAFPELQKSLVTKLCTLDRIYTEYLPVYDRAIDHAEWSDPLQLLMAHAKHMRGLLELHRLFPPGHRFWAAFGECRTRAWKAVLRERLHHHHRIQPYPLSDFETIAKGKLALYKVFTLAMPYMTERYELGDLLSRSMDEFHMGIYLLDDLQDWREDYAYSQYSYLLTRIILEKNMKEAVLSEQKPPAWIIGKHLYETGVVHEHIVHASRCFQHAADLVSELEVFDWIELNQSFARTCLKMSTECATYAGCMDAPHSGAHREGHAQVSEHRPPLSFVLHSAFPEELIHVCRTTLNRIATILPLARALTVYVGHWSDMPAHFMVTSDTETSLGINVALESPCRKSVYSRPIELEVSLAYVEAARFCVHGPSNSLLERMAVAGMGVHVCKEVLSDKEAWEILGMTLLEWQWCRKHEWYLWEATKHDMDALLCPNEGECIAMEPPRIQGSPVARNAHLYLAERVFEGVMLVKNCTDMVSLLTKMTSAGIKKTLQCYRL